MGRGPTPSTQCGPKAHTLCSPSLSDARGSHSVTQVIRLSPPPRGSVGLFEKSKFQPPPPRGSVGRGVPRGLRGARKRQPVSRLRDGEARTRASMHRGSDHRTKRRLGALERSEKALAQPRCARPQTSSSSAWRLARRSAPSSLAT